MFGESGDVILRKIFVVLVFTALAALPSTQTWAHTEIEQRLDTKEYYAENLKAVEAKNTELIVDFFIEYFWQKPVASSLQKTEISIVGRDAFSEARIWREDEALFAHRCGRSVRFLMRDAIGPRFEPTSKKLIFYNNAVTRNLNGRRANNYTFSLGEYSKDATGNYVRDTNGTCMPIPTAGSGVSASDWDTYTPSRNALAIHYALQQKGVDLGHCALRQKIGQTPDLGRLVVVDCYLESHGFNKKQASILQNVYPTVSIATYGSKFLGISVYDATYANADVGKTWAEIYTQRRTNPDAQKEYSDYLAQYISRTRANKVELNDGYFRHLDQLNSAPHFNTSEPNDFSNMAVIDVSFGGKTFPIAHAVSSFRKNELIEDERTIRQLSYGDRARFDQITRKYEPYLTDLRRPTIGVGPDEALILSLAYTKALAVGAEYPDDFRIQPGERDKFTMQAKYYSDLALSLGSIRGYSDLTRGLEPSANGYEIEALKAFVMNSNELVRLYEEGNPSVVLTGPLDMNDMARTASRHKNSLYYLMVAAMVYQSNEREGEQSPSYTVKEPGFRGRAAALAAYPDPFFKCEEIYTFFHQPVPYHYKIRPLLEQCIRAAPNSAWLKKFFDRYIEEYYSFEKAFKYSDRIDVMPVAAEKFIAFGDRENADVVRRIIASNKVAVRNNGERWRQEAATEQLAKLDAAAASDAALRAQYAADARAEEESRAAYNRRLEEKFARLRAETAGRQSTGQMISDAMGDVIASRPTIDQMAIDANRRIAASQRQAAADRRTAQLAEQRRSAAAAQAQSEQSAERAKQQREVQQRALDRRIAENTAARQRASDQRAAQATTVSQGMRASSSNHGPKRVFVFPKGGGWLPGSESGDQAGDGVLVQVKAKSLCFNDKNCDDMVVVTRITNISGVQWCGSAAISENRPTDSHISVNIGPSKAFSDETILPKGIAPIYVLVQRRIC